MSLRDEEQSGTGAFDEKVTILIEYLKKISILNSSSHGKNRSNWVFFLLPESSKHIFAYKKKFSET